MKYFIPPVLWLCCVLPSAAKVNPELLKFSLQLFQGDKLISAPSWSSMPSAEKPGTFEVGQVFRFNESMEITSGSHVKWFATRENDEVTYTMVFRIRQLKKSTGDPETQAIGSFETQEYFITGKTNLGNWVEFTVEDEKRLKLFIGDAESRTARTFHSREEALEYLEKENTE